MQYGVLVVLPLRRTGVGNTVWWVVSTSGLVADTVYASARRIAAMRWAERRAVTVLFSSETHQ